MEYFLISITAFSAALLTFFSGFGLGTLLLPAFAVFYPPEIAVALTAVVHLLNNIFKGALIGKNADFKIVLLFGIPAMLGAFGGALLLREISNEWIFYSYSLGGSVHHVTAIKVVIALLMIFFGLMELVPALTRMSFEKNWMIPGGFISGFFGGLSGHQGALRSAFLMRLHLQKEIFVATGLIVAILIDIVRISTYSTDIPAGFFRMHAPLLLTSVAAAFAGSFLGARLLKKVTIRFIQLTVGVLLILLACALGIGLV